MKKPFIIFPLAVTVFAIAACNLSGRSADSVAGNDTAKTSAAGITPSTTAKILVAHYLNLKNALAKDNSNAAATAGKSLADGFAKFDRSTLNEVQKKFCGYRRRCAANG